MSKIKQATEFSTEVRIAVKNRQFNRCLFCNSHIDHMHHALVGRRVGLGVEKNAVGLCTRHHTLIHSSGKIAARLNEDVKKYLYDYYGEIDINELKYNKWSWAKFK